MFSGKADLGAEMSFGVKTGSLNSASALFLALRAALCFGGELLLDADFLDFLGFFITWSMFDWIPITPGTYA
jgi:hypothetical protein